MIGICASLGFDRSNAAGQLQPGIGNKCWCIDFTGRPTSLAVKMLKCFENCTGLFTSCRRQTARDNNRLHGNGDFELRRRVVSGCGGDVCSSALPPESGPAAIHPSQSFRRWWTARKRTFSTPRRVIFPVVYKLGPRPLVGAARRNLNRYDELDAENSLQKAENKIRTSPIFRSQTAELFCRCDVVPTSIFHASRSSTTVCRAQ